MTAFGDGSPSRPPGVPLFQLLSEDMHLLPSISEVQSVPMA